MPDKYIKFLREQAKALEAKHPELAKVWNDHASEVEKEAQKAKASDDVEATIAARIKNGDLVPKAAHETAVAEAEKKGKEAALKEVEEKAAAEKKKQETVASRLKEIADAGLDPKFALGKDRTIESVVAAIPVGEEGDKHFAERKEEWITLSKKTGQATASNKGGGTSGKTIPPISGKDTTQSEASDKPAYAFM